MGSGRGLPPIADGADNGAGSFDLTVTRHGSSKGGATMADPEKNKQTVVAFYNLVINDKQPAEAVQKYGGPHYIQHDPQTPDGFEAFIQNITSLVEQNPQMSLDIKRVVAEGDLVVTH